MWIANEGEVVREVALGPKVTTGARPVGAPEFVRVVFSEIGDDPRTKPVGSGGPVFYLLEGWRSTRDKVQPGSARPLGL